MAQAKGSDLDKIRQIFEARTKKTPQGGNFFGPQDGETVIRLLPSTDDSGLFFKETGEHNIDGQRYYCPKLTHGNRCPICEKVNELYRSGDPEDAKIAKQFKVRKKFYSNIIVRSKEEEGPKIYGYGVKMWEKLLTYFMDADFGDLTDVKAGFDFKLIRQQKDGFPNYDASNPRPRETPLSDDPKQVKEWLDGSHDLNALVDPKVKSYAELKALMLNEQYEEDDSPAPTPAKKVVASEQPTKNKNSEEKVAEDDIDAIMNDALKLGEKEELS